jgi:hypothetical protein
LVVNARSSGAEHLACKTKNRAARARFRSGDEIVSGRGAGNV